MAPRIKTSSRYSADRVLRRVMSAFEHSDQKGFRDFALFDGQSVEIYIFGALFPPLGRMVKKLMEGGRAECSFHLF